jgi:hypothetical protein
VQGHEDCIDATLVEQGVKDGGCLQMVHRISEEAIEPCLATNRGDDFAAW